MTTTAKAASGMTLERILGGKVDFLPKEAVAAIDQAIATLPPEAARDLARIATMPSRVAGVAGRNLKSLKTSMDKSLSARFISFFEKFAGKPEITGPVLAAITEQASKVG